MSIIVAARNEEGYIEGCLRSLARQAYAADKFEIILVDDHSGDGTLREAARIAEDYPSLIRILRAPDEPREMGSKKRALTHGIWQSRGEILLFTDADNRVGPQWASAMIREFDERTGAVAGAALPNEHPEIFKRFYRLERLLVAISSASAIGLGVPGTACGQNLAIRKAALDEIGGYAHPELPSGDDDLTVQAIARAGWRVRFASAPESVVEDRRTPDLTAHANATTRHQSVTGYYPLRIRLLYILSILSGVSISALIALAALGSVNPSYAVSAVLAKTIMDAAAVRAFAWPLKIGFTARDHLLAHLLLPLYVMLRPLLLLRPGYQWRGRPVRRDARQVAAGTAK